MQTSCQCHVPNTFLWSHGYQRARVPWQNYASTPYNLPPTLSPFHSRCSRTSSTPAYLLVKAQQRLLLREHRELFATASGAASLPGPVRRGDRQHDKVGLFLGRRQVRPLRNEGSYASGAGEAAAAIPACRAVLPSAAACLRRGGWVVGVGAPQADGEPTEAAPEPRQAPLHTSYNIQQP